MNPGETTFMDPITGRLFVPPARVRALQAVWAERDAAARSGGWPANPARDTRRFSVETWLQLRADFASLWADLEVAQRNHHRSSADVVSCMATVLEPIRHELGFISGVAAEVDAILTAGV